MNKRELSLLLEEALSSDKVLGLFWEFKSALMNRLDVDTNYSVRAPVNNYVLDYNTGFDRGIKDAIIDDIIESYEDEGLLE
jgi:hypothetical protein